MENRDSPLKAKRVKHCASRSVIRKSKRVKTSQKTPKAATATPGASSSSEPAKATNPWFKFKYQELVFNRDFANKDLVPPKVLNFNWLENEKFNFQFHLQVQGLEKFVRYKPSIT